MFQIKDTEAGLSLSLGIEPDPRNPRMVDDNLFTVVAWTPGLGDPHEWASPEAFHAAITPDMAAIFPLHRAETSKGPILLRSYSDSDEIAGYAFATFERLCLAFGLDAITTAILDDTMEEAEATCLGELQAYDDFVSGQVFRYEIMNARGECIEKRRDLYGDEHARHIALTSFDRHLYSVAMDG